MRQFAVVLAAQEARLQFALVYTGLRRQHASQQRLLAHFQAEDGDHRVAVDGCILRNIDGERGFTH